MPRPCFCIGLVLALAVDAQASVTPAVKRTLASVPAAWKKLELEKALAAIEKAKPHAKSDDDQALCAAYEGVVLHTMGRPDDAQAAFRRAVELDASVKPPGKVPADFQAAFDAGLAAAKAASAPSESPPPPAPAAEAPPSAPSPPAEPAPPPTAPSAHPPQRIAVLELQASGAPPGTAASLNLLLPSELRRVLPQAHVVSGQELTDLLGFERTKQLAGCQDSASSCITEIGQALGVDELVSGSVGRLGNTYIVELRRLDVQHSRPIASVAQTAQSEREDVLVDALRLAVRKVYGLAGADVAIAASGSSRGTRRPWQYALTVGGGAMLVGGGVMGVVAGLDYSSTQSRANTGVAPSASDKSRILLEGRIADGLVVVGAVATAIGGFFLLTRDAPVALAPTGSRDSLGMALCGRF